MIDLIKIQFKRDYKHLYPAKSSIFFNLISDLGYLTFLFFMAKAFIPKESLFGNASRDYFSFIFIGEISFRLPSFMMNIHYKNLIRMQSEGVWTWYWQSSKPFASLLLFESIALSLIETLRLFILIFFAFTFFNLEAQFTSLLFFLAALIISIPFFHGLGLINAALVLLFKRGASFSNKIISLLIILAGTYFPTTVFPESFSKITNSINPLKYYLDIQRHIFSGANESFPLKATFIIFISGIFLSVVGFISLNIVKSNYKTKGEYPRLRF